MIDVVETASRPATAPAAETRSFIDGAYVTGRGARFENRNPVDGSLVSVVNEATAADVDLAVRAARAALRGPWGSFTIPERAALLVKLAAELQRRSDDFLAAEIADTGKPASLARHLDIPRSVANFSTFAELVKNVPTEAFELPTPDGLGALNYGIRRPRGVIAVVCPWNLPLLADDVEGRARPRVRQHRRREAERGDAEHRIAAGRMHECRWRSAGRLQRRARLRTEFRG